jgi:tRNA (guanosine-2'-O-)-methyltransferase
MTSYPRLQLHGPRRRSASLEVRKYVSLGLPSRWPFARKLGQLVRAAFFFGAMVACPGPGPKGAEGAGLDARVLPGAELELDAACTPTGPELCFNAIDDNCNGVIDEGCGVATGLLQFTIAWGDSKADVDLSVTDPDGVRVHEGNKSSKSGLRLDKDCPSDDGCHGQNIENVFLETGEPQKGIYGVEIKLSQPRGAEMPVKVRLSARMGGRVLGATALLRPGDDKKSFRFEL